MKPANFPWRKERRRLRVKMRSGYEPTKQERDEILLRPLDIKLRWKYVLRAAGIT